MEIESTLENYRTMPLGMAEGEDFRISLAGAQEKTALLLHEDRWHQPFHTTPTTHIFKLPIGRNGILDLLDSVENEWICHLILKEFGIPVADAWSGCSHADGSSDLLNPKTAVSHE